MLIAHRINTIEDLQLLPSTVAIEFDVRDSNGLLIIEHDPFAPIHLDIDTFLMNVGQRFLIVNIKSEGIEYKVLSLLQKYKIESFFLLDCSFPMLVKLSSIGESRLAVRFSEYESIETVLSLAKKVKWVWVDCFTKNPLTKEIEVELHTAGFKLCYVSPELQQQPEKRKEYIEYFHTQNIRLDAVCTKHHYFSDWERLF